MARPRGGRLGLPLDIVERSHLPRLRHLVAEEGLVPVEGDQLVREEAVHVVVEGVAAGQGSFLRALRKVEVCFLYLRIALRVEAFEQRLECGVVQGR